MIPLRDQFDSWAPGIAAFSLTTAPCPGYRGDQWNLIHRHALDFLDIFGAQAKALGCTAWRRFVVHPVAGVVRFEACGVFVPPVAGAVRVITATEIRFDHLTYQHEARPAGPRAALGFRPMIAPADACGPYACDLDEATRQALQLSRLLTRIAVVLPTAPARHAVWIIRRRLEGGNAGLVGFAGHAVGMDHFVGGLTRCEGDVAFLQHDGLDRRARQARRERALLRNGRLKTSRENDSDSDGSEASHDNLPKPKARTLSCAVVANVSSALLKSGPDDELKRGIGHLDHRGPGRCGRATPATLYRLASHDRRHVLASYAALSRSAA